MAGRGGGRETPHQTSDWFKRGPAKPHSLKGKDGLGFRETPETSPRKRWLWLEVAAELRGPGAPPLSGRLPPGERGGWLEAGRALQLGSVKSPPLPLPGAPSHCPPFSGTPSGCWRLEPAPPGSPPLAWGELQPRLRLGPRSGDAAKFAAVAWRGHAGRLQAEVCKTPREPPPPPPDTAALKPGPEVPEVSECDSTQHSG